MDLADIKNAGVSDGFFIEIKPAARAEFRILNSIFYILYSGYEVFLALEGMEMPCGSRYTCSKFFQRQFRVSLSLARAEESTTL
jgi:hypothetical protein